MRLAAACVLGYARSMSPSRSAALLLSSALLACGGGGGGGTAQTASSSTGEATVGSTGSTGSTTGAVTASTGASVGGSSGAPTSGASGTEGTGAGSTSAGGTSAGGTSAGSTGAGSTSAGSTSGSETGGVRECAVHPDCPPGQICVQSCTDDCDQSMYPNPCCQRDCAALAPLSCQAVGGACAAECPKGTYPAANADVWACGQPTGCCLPEVEGCAEHLHRFACESQVACVWVLADCEIENCNFPDKGTCQAA